MNEGTTRFLGLDVHKATITVAVAEECGPPSLYGTIANDPGAVCCHQPDSPAQASHRPWLVCSAQAT